MPSKKEIQIFSLSKSGKSHEINLDQIKDQGGTIWIRSNLTSIKYLLSKLSSQPPLVKEVLSAKITRPRTLVYADTLLATFRGVNLNVKSSPEDMVSVRIFIQKNLIITVQQRRLATTDEIERTLKEGIGPKTSAEFLEVMLCSMTDKSIEVVSDLGDRLDHIEDALVENTSSDNRIELSDMRRRIITLRRYLIPQREAISRISIDKISWLDGINLMHLKELTDSSTRLIEDLDAEKERATVIHEELFAQAQEKMNKKMYLLTIIAVIFMPLSFITGLLGINVGGIPGANFHYGFIIVCLLLASLSIVQCIYLKKKRWV